MAYVINSLVNGDKYGFVTVGTDIYAATTVGRLYKLVGSTWTLIVNATIGTGSYCLLATDGINIYAVTSGLPTFGNDTIYKWDGATGWTNLSFTTSGLSAGFILTTSPVCFGGDLYFIAIGTAQVIKYSGGVFSNLGTLAGASLIGGYLAIFGGNLYAVGNSGILYLVSAGTLTLKAPAVMTVSATFTQFMQGASIIGFNGALYLCNNPNNDAVHGGSLWVWDNVSAWTSLVPYNTAYISSFLAVFNNDLFLFRNAGNVYRWDGANSFVQVPTTVSYQGTFTRGAQTFLTRNNNGGNLSELAIGSSYTPPLGLIPPIP